MLAPGSEEERTFSREQGVGRRLANPMALTGFAMPAIASMAVLITWARSHAQGIEVAGASIVSCVLLAGAWMTAKGPGADARQDGAVYIVAFGARACFLVGTLAAWGWDGVFPAGPDATNYHNWAGEIAARLPARLLDIRGFDAAGTYDIFYPYLLGVLLWFLGGSLVAVMLVQCALASVACILLLRVAREVSGEAGADAALLWSLCPHALYFAGGNLLKDSVFPLLVFGSIWVVVRVLREGGAGAFLWGGGGSSC